MEATGNPPGVRGEGEIGNCGQARTEVLVGGGGGGANSNKKK